MLPLPSEVMMFPVSRGGPLFSINFISGSNISLVNGAGGVAGFAEKLDALFQSFAGGSLRKTDRGVLVEPAATNLIAPSSFQNAAYTLTNSFASVNAKTPLIPGGTAWEYVANATSGLLNRTSLGTFSASRETLAFLIETTATSNKFLLYMADASNGSAASISMEVSTLLTAPTITFGLGNATSKVYGQVNLGIGPNGGTVYLFVVSGIPLTAGNTRRVFLYPNGNGVVAGSSIIVHHPQYEVNNQSTSPILNPSTTALSRLAEVITAAIANGTYDIRYSTQDGILNNDRLAVVVSGGALTIPTDITEKSGPLVPIQPLTVLRNGYIASIDIWNQTSAIHVLGDSFAEAASYMLPYLPSRLYRPRAWTFDGVGGSTLVQEAARFDLTPQFYADVLNILDGGLDDPLVNALAAINSMIAHLTANPKKWLYIQSSPSAGFAIGTPTYTTWLATNAGIKAAFPSNYVDTLALMQTHGDGSANDNSDIANGWWPRSLRIDDIHPNRIGAYWLSQIIGNAIQTRGY